MREIHCHKMVRAVAIEMAGELYDTVMRDNTIFHSWKSVCPELTPTLAEIKFIELMWPKLIDAARTTMAKMLTTNITTDLKDEIARSLILDNTLRRGRGRVQTLQ